LPAEIEMTAYMHEKYTVVQKEPVIITIEKKDSNTTDTDEHMQVISANHGPVIDL
jgi:hypothetical protein